MGLHFLVLGKVCKSATLCGSLQSVLLGNTKSLGKDRIFKTLQWNIDDKTVFKRFIMAYSGIPLYGNLTEDK